MQSGSIQIDRCCPLWNDAHSQQTCASIGLATHQVTSDDKLNVKKYTFKIRKLPTPQPPPIPPPAPQVSVELKTSCETFLRRVSNRA
jgi:hypothetical protein